MQNATTSELPEELYPLRSIETRMRGNPLDMTTWLWDWRLIVYHHQNPPGNQVEIVADGTERTWKKAQHAANTAFQAWKEANPEAVEAFRVYHAKIAVRLAHSQTGEQRETEARGAGDCLPNA